MSDLDNSASQLLRFWKKGQKKELDLILKRHLPWIQAFVHKKLGAFPRSKADTGDVVQEALIEFIKHGPRFQLSSEKQLRALLCRIVTNTLGNMYDWFTAYRRTLAKERPLPPDTLLNLDPPRDCVTSPSQIAQKQEQEAWIRMAMELLSPDDRMAVLLRNWDDMSFQEIGERMGLSKGGARNRYLDALDRLQRIVESLKKGELNTLLGPEEDHDP